MRLELTNIGPVRSATIDLNSLTVFVGPNNSGKSLVATTIYAILSSVSGPRPHAPFSSGRYITAPPRIPLPESRRIVAAFEEAMEASEGIPDYTELPKIFREFFAGVTSANLNLFSAAVIEELERTLATDIKGLRRVQKRATAGQIQVISNDPDWQLAIKIRGDGPQISVEFPQSTEIWNNVRSQKRFLNQVFRYRTNSRQFLVEFARVISSAIFAGFPAQTKYLPAARSGLMQSHKILAGTLIRRASMAGLEEVRIPAMSGVVTDFLGELVELDYHAENPDFEALGAFLESEILHGSVQIDSTTSGSPELYYRSENGDFPLSRTSSMVSELAPVVIYLKRILRRGDFLFIEEPEAHLHPASQVILAQFIIRLVNSGLKVGLTTHSEYFLQQINNSIAAGDIPGNRSHSVPIDSDARIRAESVSAYAFRPTRTGTIVTPLNPTAREGIPDSGFDTVSEMLYTQNVRLDRLQNG